MGFIDKLSFRAEKACAGQLVAALVKDIPKDLKAGQGKPLTANRVTRFLERTCQAACEFRDATRMGVLGRVVLANSFKWELKSKGYSDEFVELATEALLVSLSKK